MAKMTKTLTVVFFAMFLCSLFSLTGCDDPEKENAVAEAAEAKTALSKVKETMAGIVSERDNLKLKLTTVTEARDKLKTAVEKAKEIKGQLAGITKQRDEALAKMADAQTTIANLKSKLSGHIQKITGLEGQNKKLLDMIAELKKNLGGGAKIPAIPKL